MNAQQSNVLNAVNAAIGRFNCTAGFNPRIHEATGRVYLNASHKATQPRDGFISFDDAQCSGARGHFNTHKCDSKFSFAITTAAVAANDEAHARELIAGLDDGDEREDALYFVFGEE